MGSTLQSTSEKHKNSEMDSETIDYGAEGSSDAASLKMPLQEDTMRGLVDQTIEAKDVLVKSNEDSVKANSDTNAKLVKQIEKEKDIELQVALLIKSNEDLVKANNETNAMLMKQTEKKRNLKLQVVKQNNELWDLEQKVAALVKSNNDLTKPNSETNAKLVQQMEKKKELKLQVVKQDNEIRDLELKLIGRDYNIREINKEKNQIWASKKEQDEYWRAVLFLIIMMTFFSVFFGVIITYSK